MDHLELRKKKQMTLTKPNDCAAMCRGFFDFEQGRVYDTIISGGRLSDRTAMELSLLQDLRILTAKGGRPEPAILLHQHNGYLSQALCREGNSVTLPGQRRCSLSLLQGIQDCDLAAVLFYTARNRFGSSTALLELLRIGIELLRLGRQPITLQSLHALPWHSLQREVERLAAAGILEGEEMLEMMGRADASRTERDSASLLFEELSLDQGMVQPAPNSCGLQQALDCGGIVCLDLPSNQQKTLKELYFQLFRLFARQQRRFLLVLDGVSFWEDGSEMRQMLLDKDTAFSWIVSGPDIASVLGQDLHSFLGGVNVVLFAHGSGNSATAWADFFGQTYQLKVSTSSSRSHDEMRFLGSQSTRGETRDMERRYRILPEAIQSLAAGEALVQAASPSSVPWYVDIHRYLNAGPGPMRLLRD